MRAKLHIIKNDSLGINNHWTLIEFVDDIINGRIGLKPLKESVYAS